MAVCRMCGCILTTDNTYTGITAVCKECHKKRVWARRHSDNSVQTDHAAACKRWRDKKRKTSPDYVSSEKARARAYYHSTGQQQRDDRMAKYKTPCLKCGETRVYCICFHHVDPHYKTFNIGGGTPKNADEQSIADEVSKCVCLCHNCHKEFHHFYGNRMKHPREALEEYLGMKLPTFEEKENENA